MSRNNVELRLKTNLGNLTGTFGKLSSQIGRSTGDFKKFQVQTRKLNDRFVNMNRDANRSTKTFDKMGKSLFSLGNIIKGIGIYKLSGMLKDAMKASMDMIETTHLFEVSLRELAVETDEYIQNMSEVTGLDVGNLRNRIGTFNMLARTMGMTAKNAQTLGIGVNALALDMGALFNVSYQQVAEDLRSGLIGQSRTMYKYGIDVTEAAIKTEALNRGIMKSVRHMTQGEKMALRYSVMIKQMSIMQGDFAETINTPMNQLRVMNERFATLARTVGSLFMPALQRILPVLNAVVTLMNRLFAGIASFFGIKSTPTVKNMESDFDAFGDSAEDAEDAVGGVGKAVKKLRKQLAGFDELNIITTKPPESSSGGGGGGDDMGAFDFELELYDALFDSIRQKSDEIADSIANWFKENTMPFTDSLKDLWERGLKPMMEFTGANLVSFLHNFLEPVGAWVLGEDGIPRLVTAMTNLMSNIDWDSLLESLTLFYEALARFTIGIGGGMILFFEDLIEFLEPVILELLDWFGVSLENLADTMNNIPDEKLEKIGYVIGGIATSLIAWGLLKGIFSGIVTLLTPLITKLGSVVGWIGKFAGALGIPLGPAVLLIIELVAIGIAIADLYTENEEFKNNIKKIWNEIGKIIKKIWDKVLKPIFETFKEVVLDVYNDGIKPFVEDSVKAIKDFVVLVSPELSALIDNMQPVIDIFNLLLKVVGLVVIGSLNYLGEFLKGSVNVVKDLLDVFKGIITFLDGVFTSDWTKIWEGLVQVFKGIINGINNIFGAVINSVISGINAMIRGLNKIQIPDWVPLMGGKGINIGEIPRFNPPQLASGGEVSMGQMFIAREAGAELVGNFGGRSGVMNNDNIVEAVSKGVSQAVREVMGGDNQQPISLVVNVGEDTLVDKLINGVNRESRIQGRTVIRV